MPPTSSARSPPGGDAGRRRQREGAGGRPALAEPRLGGGHGALRQAHHYGHPLERLEVALGEASTDGTARGPRARERRPLVARVARHLQDRRRRPHDGRRDIDRDVPLVPDRVPIQLDMVPEPVQCGLDPVPDRVRVPAGDRAVRVADLDGRDPSAGVLDHVVGGRIARRRHRLDPQRKLPVVRVVVPELGRDLADDPVPLRGTEVVGDRLGDPQRSVALDHDLDVVPDDPLAGEALRTGGRRQDERREHAQRDRRDPPHSVSTKKNEMAMIR